MKRNLMSVIILALVFANFVLTALLLFTVLPETKKANQMIEDVCAAIDLELNSGDASGVTNIPIADQDNFALNGGESMLMSLAPAEDGKVSFLSASVSLTLNKKSDGYSTYGTETLTNQDSSIQSVIEKIIDDYTYEEFNANKDKIYKEILKELQKSYGGDFIVAVNFSSVVPQK